MLRGIDPDAGQWRYAPTITATCGHALRCWAQTDIAAFRLAPDRPDALARRDNDGGARPAADLRRWGDLSAMSTAQIARLRTNRLMVKTILIAALAEGSALHLRDTAHRPGCARDGLVIRPRGRDLVRAGW